MSKTAIVKGIFLRNALKKILIKNKWTINYLYSLSFLFLLSALNINYVRDHLLNIPTKLVPIDVVVSEKKIKMQKFTDAKRWLYIAWPFGLSELIRCCQTSHLFRHRGARNVFPTDVKRAAGLIPRFVLVYYRLYWILFKYTLTSSSSGKCVCFGRGLTCGIA
jgi:hypothetical protein